MSTNFKPFDLEAAMRGAPIQFKNGGPCKFIAFCEDAKYPVIVLGPYKNVLAFPKKGTFSNNTSWELVMAPKLIKYWYNVYLHKKTKYPYLSSAYSSEQEAKEVIENNLENNSSNVEFYKTIVLEIED